MGVMVMSYLLRFRCVRCCHSRDERGSMGFCGRYRTGGHELVQRTRVVLVMRGICNVGMSSNVVQHSPRIALLEQRDVMISVGQLTLGEGVKIPNSRTAMINPKRVFLTVSREGMRFITRCFQVGLTLPGPSSGLPPMLSGPPRPPNRPVDSSGRPMLSFEEVEEDGVVTRGKV